MKTHVSRTITPLLFIFFILSRALVSLAQERPTQLVIFAVWPAQKGKTPDSPLIDPIAILEDSQFKNPGEYINDEKLDTNYKEFVRDYLANGTQYPMLFGGGSNGGVSVEGQAGISCGDLTAIVNLSPHAHENQRMLAVSSIHGLGLHYNWRRIATPNERAAFLSLAADFYKRQGVVGVSSSLLKLTDLRATRLGKAESSVLIGSIRLNQKTEAHNLFLVASFKNAKWEIELSTDHVTKDIPEGTDDEAEDFLDQLDLDNDGVDEIVTMSSYYESWNYTIYKKQDGIWKRIYKGGGGGC